MTFFLYQTENIDWDYENKCKLGFTQDYKRRMRDSREQHSHLSRYTYLVELETNENCHFSDTFQADKIIFYFAKKYKINSLETLYNCSLPLLREIEKYLIQQDGSTEFIHKNGRLLFQKIIIEEFPKLGFDIVKIFSQEELNEINENNRILNDIDNENNFIKKIQPNTLQQSVLEKNYFENNDIGKLLWCCGLGKSFASLFLSKQIPNVKNIIIGVYSVYLQDEFYKSVKRIYPYSNILLFCGDNESLENHMNKKHENENITITTYHSCYKIKEYCEKNNFKFDFKIGDEAHHLVTSRNIPIEEMNRFIRFHEIPSRKTLFMTATEKISSCPYSMDNELLFGKVIDKKSVKWAIDNQMITDYNVLVIKNNEEEMNRIISSFNQPSIQSELFISAYITLVGMSKYFDLTHNLIYCNTIENACLIQKYVQMILESNILPIDTSDFYVQTLHSKSSLIFQDEINKFKNSKQGIVTSVFMFSEGFDLPELNSVTFAENMDSSIRIVQASLRPNRLCKKQPNKIAYVLIPYIDNGDWNNEKPAFKTIRTILSELANNDECLEHKMKVLSCKQEINDNEEENNTLNYSGTKNDNLFLEWIEDDEENVKLKIRLRHCKTLNSRNTEIEDEYFLLREINKKLEIRNEAMYNDYKNKNPYFRENPRQHFRLCWKNWYDFLGTNTSGFILKKEDWIHRCHSLNIYNCDMYSEFCIEHKEFPEMPEEFYKDFTNIDFELRIREKRR